GVDTIWFDDALPAGAVKDNNIDNWDWVSKDPYPESGTRAHQSAIASGMHQQMFTGAASPLVATNGQTLYPYVYIHPPNVPSEVMIQWNDGSSWSHRAYWGANNLQFTGTGSAALYYMGQLPTPGQWVRLEVPADKVGLVGVPIRGMAFSLYGGRATWDNTGKS